MIKFGYINKIGTKVIHARYIFVTVSLLLAPLTPLLITAPTASASTTFTNYSTTSSYTTPGSVTTANGSLWYIEGTSTAPKDYIGNMTTSGTVTDYNISYPTGTTKFIINALTTGPDGNVWFAGCANPTGSGSVYAGFLDVSTGAVTFYHNTRLHLQCDTSDGPTAIATGPDNYVWYTDESSEAAGDVGYIFSVSPSTGTTTTAAGPTTNWFYDSLTAGPDGRLWYTVPAGNAVYARTVSSGAFTGIPGGYNVPTLSSDPTSIVSGPDGNLWFVENVSPAKIAKVTPSGSFTEYTLASGVSPRMLTTGPDGAVWFVDGSSLGKIGRISSTGNVTEYAVPGTGLNGVNGLTLGPDGAMWFTYRDYGGAKLGRLVVTPDFTNYPTTSSYTTPGSVTTANGSLWYIEGTTSAPKDSIGNMTTSGTVTDYNISYPTGTTKFTINTLTTGPDGNVWFAGCANTTGGVYAGFLNVSTGAVTFYKNTRYLINCLSDGPTTMATGPDGYVWYADVNNEAAGDVGYLFSVNPSTGTTSAGYSFGPTWSVNSLATGPDGRLWYTLPANNVIYASTVSSGTITGVSSGYHVPTLNSNPASVVSGPDGNLWFVESTNSKIAKVTTSGSFVEYSPASGVLPGMLTAGSDGAVWFVDASSTPKIGRITSSGIISEYTVPGASVSNVNGLTLGPDGALWFIYRDSGGSKVGRLGY